ncbi:MAG: FGGY family carbohydrate kinase [Aggregatilineales bacterium]
MTWLALDIGTTGTKAALVNDDGTILRSETRTYPTHHGADGVAEQNANDWWEAIQSACVALNITDGEHAVTRIAITGQMQDVILIDADGQPVHPVILYSDSRARQEAETVNETIGTEKLIAMTAIEQGAGSLLSKTLWLKVHAPDALTDAKHLLLGAADYAAFMLTGNAASDTTTASTTGLIDVHTRAPFNTELYSALGLERVAGLLPPLVKGGAKVGELTPSSAQALGLSAGIPVHLGPGDAGAATLGAGSGETGTAYAYLGTSGWVAFTSQTVADHKRGVITLNHPHDSRYIAIAPLLTAGGNLDWVRDLFLSEESYADLIGKGLEHPPTNLIYLPYLNGERSPFTDPLARGAFVGLSAGMDKSALVRAVLEGVVYAYRHALDALMPDPVDTLTITGGGTRSLTWCGLFADILGVKVNVAGDAENVGLRGAILAAQVATGERADYAPEGFFPIVRTLQPDATNKALYDKKYAVFKGLYPALKASFGALE